MTQTLDAAIAQFHPPLPLTVALSGGADSTALLVACARRWPGQVQAVHINHGLQVAASAFEDHCTRLCAALQVPLYVARVQAHARPGESPEDAARKARYQAFDDLARTNATQLAMQNVAFAHNADDQLETVLLALGRGSGLPGLAAMPAQWQRGELACFRPLLTVAAADIRVWLRARPLEWVEDPTNADQRYTRNRIRHTVVPALRQAFAHAADTAARCAEHAAQAQRLLDALAADDLTQLASGQGLPYGLPIQGLRALTPDRQANVLRYWLKLRYGVAPTAAQLAELQRQLACCNTGGHRIHIRLGRGTAQRQGRLLVWHPEGAGR